MKRIFTEISAFTFIVAVLFSAGCLSDDLGRSDNGSGTGSTEPTIPDNSVIDAGMFSASIIWRRRLCWSTTADGPM